MQNSYRKSERETQFDVSSVARSIAGLHPSADDFRQALISLPVNEVTAYLRGYVRSRVPAAFAKQPMLWEAMRNWISERLGVDSHEVGLNGSAQLGFSVSPKQFGKVFSEINSDLDFFIVSEKLFSELQVEIQQFCSNDSSAHRDRFKDQIETIQRTLGRGFFDLKQVPNFDNYPKCSRANNFSSIIVHKLRFHEFKLKYSYFRIYKSWNNFSRQTRINHLQIREKLK